jgi:hypothetical protein
MAPFDPANGAAAIAASAVDAAPSRPATIVQAASNFIISPSRFFQSGSRLRQAAIATFPQWMTTSFSDAVGVGNGNCGLDYGRHSALAHRPVASIGSVAAAVVVRCRK